MAYQLTRLTAAGDAKHPDAASGEWEARVRGAIERLTSVERQRYRRLWAYYRNSMRVCAAGAMQSGADRPYRQAQEWGLPSRITGVISSAEAGALGSSQPAGEAMRKEVVIENDIGWRIDTMVDYLFGKPLVIASKAEDPTRRQVIGELIRLILAHNGGVLFLQQMALLGAVYGFVDVLVKLEGASKPREGLGIEARSSDSDGSHDRSSADEAAVVAERGGATTCGGVACGAGDLGERAMGDGGAVGERPVSSAEQVPPGAGAFGREGGEDDRVSDDLAGTNDLTESGADTTPHGALEALARMIRLEIVEPARALPLLSPWDYRVVQAYGQVYSVRKSAVGSGQVAVKRSKGRWGLGWLSRDGSEGVRTGAPKGVEVVEIISVDRWQRYEDEVLMAEGSNSLGEIPLVHIQNTASPFEYAGQSDVEGLIALQDELNIRLSDRANRITMQSFKMYLGKGIDNFTELPVAPGRMWMSDNDQADVVEFGGDAGNPSEDAHIADIREAIDKASSVTPVAAGAIKNRIGRLTSAAALRVTLLALLAKTDRKRTSYGLGIERICELALGWLGRAGVGSTTPGERRIELHWPSPLPENDLEKLQEAEIKRRLGVDEAVVLRELGY